MSFGSPYTTLPDFTYHKPGSVAEVLDLLSKHGDEVEIMAGGVGLVAFMKERLVSPEHIVDVRGISDFRQLTYDGRKGLRIGATVTLAEIISNETVRTRYQVLHEAVSRIADPIIRKRATLVGNMCEAIPWVDSPPALISLGAKVEIVSPKGTRYEPVETFIKGPVDVDLESNEVVVGIGIPEFPEDGRSAFEKFNAGAEFSIANVAAALSTERGKRKARIVFGAVNSTPLRSIEAEKIVEEEGLTHSAKRRAADTASETVACVDDVLASADYRKHLIKLITMKALERMAIKK